MLLPAKGKKVDLVVPRCWVAGLARRLRLKSVSGSVFVSAAAMLLLWVRDSVLELVPGSVPLSVVVMLRTLDPG